MHRDKAFIMCHQWQGSMAKLVGRSVSLSVQDFGPKQRFRFAGLTWNWLCVLHRGWGLGDAKNFVQLLWNWLSALSADCGVPQHLSSSFSTTYPELGRNMSSSSARRGVAAEHIYKSISVLPAPQVLNIEPHVAEMLCHATSLYDDDCNPPLSQHWQTYALCSTPIVLNHAIAIR